MIMTLNSAQTLSLSKTEEYFMQIDKTAKNMNEGTPILKLAMVKRL